MWRRGVAVGAVGVICGVGGAGYSADLGRVKLRTVVTKAGRSAGKRSGIVAMEVPDASRREGFFFAGVALSCANATAGIRVSAARRNVVRRAFISIGVFKALYHERVR